MFVRHIATFSLLKTPLSPFENICWTDFYLMAATQKQSRLFDGSRFVGGIRYQQKLNDTFNQEKRQQFAHMYDSEYSLSSTRLAAICVLKNRSSWIIT